MLTKKQIKKINNTLQKVMKMEWLESAEPYAQVNNVNYDVYEDIVDLDIHYGTKNMNRTVTLPYMGMEYVGGQFLQHIIEED